MSNSWSVKKHVGKQFSLGSISLAPKLFGTFLTVIEAMNQQQLIGAIEQKIDDLSFINEDYFNQYCENYYDKDDEPIVELFTPQLLDELEKLIDELGE
jgi:hypothetical protein